MRPPEDAKQALAGAELFQRGYSAYQAHDYAEAERLYVLGANNGDANCMYTLGYFYAEGIGVKQDYSVAQTWYQRSADRGNKVALYNIGLLYWRGGPGIPRNVQEAISRLRQAADGGFNTAAWMIGRIYRDGDGVGKDSGESMQWFQRAADQGNVDAMAELGRIYAAGQLVPRDCTAAHRWFALAAEHGSLPAQAWLAANLSCS